MRTTVPDEEVAQALTKNAYRQDRGDEPMWRFHSDFGVPPAWHSDANARRIARFCLMLELPVSDVMTSPLFGALVDEVAAIRDAVSRLGGTFR
jgi:hypothetical protein